MAGKGKFELIYPPNRLAAKAPRQGGPKLEEIVDEAKEGLQKLDGDYRQWLQADLDVMSESLRGAQSDPGSSAELMTKIHGISHDIKGQGATFGFPLITEVAQSLCSLIKNDAHSAADRVKLVAFHIDSMRVIAAHDIRGSGGEQGRELVERLHAAVDKALAA